MRKDPKVGGGVGGTYEVAKNQTQHSPSDFGSSNVASFGSSNVASFGSSNVASFGSSNVASFGSSNVARFGSSNVANFSSSYVACFQKYKTREMVIFGIKDILGITSGGCVLKCRFLVIQFSSAFGVKFWHEILFSHFFHPTLNTRESRITFRAIVCEMQLGADIDSDFVPVSVHSVQYTDFVHSVALSDSEHSKNYVHSENMAQPPTPPGPRERTLREMAAPDLTYDSLCIQYPNEDVPYVLKTGLIHLLPKLNGLAVFNNLPS
ncbi:hypothetical protein Lal_00014554 [Lupinus albus]|nr:hypothetical protein Lal_00014554 [Lupinus albus]